jgi:hypothetical protein
MLMFSQQTARIRSAWRIVLIFACLGLATMVVRGEQGTNSDPEDTRERLVMLTSGRILSGQVSRNAGGYLVEQANGRVQVSADEVRFVVNDLKEAYRQQRDSIVHPTPATHVALANWCISHRLNDEARDELKKCLKSDPNHEEARRLLQRLTDTMRAGLPPAAVPPAPIKTSDGFLQPNVESLGGLSRETATLFTSRIQPILLNKCGNASCHGTTAKNGFHLYNARSGGNGSRQNSERNLAEALRYIDFDDVSQSQLLSLSSGGHGGRGSIFTGPAASDQFKLLRSWAFTVAREKQAEANEFEQMPKITGKKNGKTTSPRVSQAVHQGDDRAGMASQEDEAELIPASGQLIAKPGKLSKPREIASNPGDDQATPVLQPFDPFDPEIFNRRLR